MCVCACVCVHVCVCVTYGCRPPSDRLINILPVSYVLLLSVYSSEWLMVAMWLTTASLLMTVEIKSKQGHLRWELQSHLSIVQSHCPNVEVFY